MGFTARENQGEGSGKGWTPKVSKQPKDVAVPVKPLASLEKTKDANK